MGNKTALKAEFKLKTIEGRIKGLAKQLFQLAPHPENPDHSGPLFISLNSEFKPAAEYEGMLGSMMLESFLGEAFGEAANDNTATGVISAANLDVIAETLSEYMQEREGQKRGKGTFALGEHKTICNSFNIESDPVLSAYLADLDERLKIEETIAELEREHDAAKYQAQMAFPALEAA